MDSMVQPFDSESGTGPTADTVNVVSDDVREPGSPIQGELLRNKSPSTAPNVVPVTIPNDGTASADGDVVQPVTAPAVMVPSLRGKLIVDGNLHVCRGVWGMSDAAHSMPGQTSDFEFKLVKADHGEAPVFPQSGKYQGWFNIRLQKLMKVDDKDMTLTFTQSANGAYTVEGRGMNKFGTFALKGSMTYDGMVQLYRTYDPKAPLPKKRTVSPSDDNGMKKASPTADAAAAAERETQQRMRRKSSFGAAFGGEGGAAGVSLAPNMVKCVNLLKDCTKVPYGIYFLEPVDPIKLGIPTYPDIIKRPMDYRTVREKIDSGDISTPESFAEHMRLVFQNAIVFNQLNTNPVHIAAKECSKHFEDRYRKMNAAQSKPQVSKPQVAKPQPAPKAAPSPAPARAPAKAAASPAPAPPVVARQESLSSSDTVRSAKQKISKCENLLKECMKFPHGIYFLEPVDPIKLGIPTYPDIIKRPMDYRTVREKIDSGDISTPESFAEHMRLVYQNAIRFNEMPTNPVHVAAKECSKHFEDRYRKMNASTAAGYTDLARELVEAPAAKKVPAPKAVKQPPRRPSAQFVPPPGPRAQTQFIPPPTDVNAHQLTDMMKRMEEMQNEIMQLRTAVKQNEVQQQIESQREAAHNPLTFEEKQALVTKISSGTLPDSKMAEIINIIKSVHNTDGSEDVEVPLDELDTLTLRKLQKVIEDHEKKKRPSSSSSGAAVKKPRKSGGGKQAAPSTQAGAPAAASSVAVEATSVPAPSSSLDMPGMAVVEEHADLLFNVESFDELNT